MASMNFFPSTFSGSLFFSYDFAARRIAAKFFKIYGDSKVQEAVMGLKGVQRACKYYVQRVHCALCM